MKSIPSTVRSVASITALLAVIVVAISSCAKNHITDNSTAGAKIMAFNLSIDKTIGFTLNGNNVTSTPLAFSNFTGGYVNVDSGQYAVTAYDAATTNSGHTLASAAGAFSTNKYYSVFFVGRDSTYQNVLVSDNLDQLTGESGKAYIRFMNAIPDSTAAPVVTVAAAGTTVLSGEASYPGIFDFTSVNAGDLVVTAKNGSDIDVTKTITVAEKTVYTILLTGMPGSTAAPAAIQYIANGSLQ
ncbi:MAG: DUF4397 domain-containing protein [Chitinophagaceae bacterium]